MTLSVGKDLTLLRGCIWTISSTFHASHVRERKTGGTGRRGILHVVTDWELGGFVRRLHDRCGSPW